MLLWRVLLSFLLMKNKFNAGLRYVQFIHFLYSTYVKCTFTNINPHWPISLLLRLKNKNKNKICSLSKKPLKFPFFYYHRDVEIYLQYKIGSVIHCCP